MRPSGPAAFTQGFRSSLDYTKAAAAGTGVGAYTGLSAPAPDVTLREHRGCASGTSLRP